jgi:MFS family permease
LITSTDQHDPQAFSLLAGRAGLNGWQWVFLLFGIITVALGVLSIFLIVDFPDKATFLTPEEKAYAMRRVEEDRGDSIPDEVTFKKILTHLSDLKLWAFALCFMSSTTASCEPRFPLSRFFLPHADRHVYTFRRILLREHDNPNLVRG